MTYILLTLFVYGLHKVIWSFADFFDLDLERLYHNVNIVDSKLVEFDGYRPKWQKFLMKPIFYCNVCMSSFWGAGCYFFMFGGESIRLMALHCIISAGLITIINRFMER